MTEWEKHLFQYIPMCRVELMNALLLSDLSEMYWSSLKST